MKNSVRVFSLINIFFVMMTLEFFIFSGTMIIPVYPKSASAAGLPNTADHTILPQDAQIHLTEEEKEYIRERGIVKAVSVRGAAPIQYENSKGEVKGISVSVLKRISEMTGLHFEYMLFDSGAQAISDEPDMIFGIPPNYAPHGMLLSIPFLRSETILFINSSLQLKDLESLKYAAVKGSALPEGVDKNNAIYFNTREESLNAVNNGTAGYGFGNAYSVAYYTLMHGYKNIVTVPKGKESRAYCFGVLNNDQMLLSIINKAIASITPEELQTLVLSIASDVERDLTFRMLIDGYGIEISLIILLVIGILLYSLLSNIRTNRLLGLQNRKYEVLSGISNELLYEYDVKTRHLQLSDRSVQIFSKKQLLEEAAEKLKKLLDRQDDESSEGLIKFPSEDGTVASFKTVSTTVYDSQGKRGSIIGKLVDISEETAEKEELIAKARLDGLTDIYNAATTKELIVDRIKNKQDDEADSFIVIDVDNFKYINDTYGHLVGDEILKSVGTKLKKLFRKTDIVGRVGGDEFCVYIKNFTDPAFLIEKCEQLLSTTEEEGEEIKISLSIGVTMVHSKETYDDLFKRADAALYEAKEKGKAQFIFYT